MNEDQILQRIVDTYREFLHFFSTEEKPIEEDEIREEIYSHKEFLVNERQTIKERVDENAPFYSKNDKTEEERQVFEN